MTATGDAPTSAADLVARRRGSDGLAHALVDAGHLTPAQLDEVLVEVAATGRGLDSVLMDRGLVTETDFVVTAALHLGHLYVDLQEYPIDVSAVTTISEATARRFRALPIDWDEGTLLVAMTNPADVFVLDDIRLITRVPVRPLVATPSALRWAIDRYFRSDTDDILGGAETEPEAPSPGEFEGVADSPVVQLVNVVLGQALADRASDIHLEPSEQGLRVRFRIDGVLHDAMRVPKAMQSSVVSRLKVMAELDIAERRLPQDGRISASFNGVVADLRVATMPTLGGEQVILRVADRSRPLPTVDDLALLDEVRPAFDEAIARPYGTILATGPTGSGKTTTLYVTLAAINDPTKKVITVEDPVEFRLPGISQSQVHVKAGITFATALRSILRSDPDVLLVGEIRDRETAHVAMEAAMTGHLVLSTVHTKDASSTPLRLIEMGIEPFLVATGLDCVIAQRLARRLCERCKEPRRATSADRAVLADALGEDAVPQSLELFGPVGCRACGRTGYYERFGLYEVMLVDEDMTHLIAERAPSEVLRDRALANGMVPLRAAGLRRALDGWTSLEEILRVIR